MAKDSTKGYWGLSHISKRKKKPAREIPPDYVLKKRKPKRRRVNSTSQQHRMLRSVRTRSCTDGIPFNLKAFQIPTPKFCPLLETPLTYGGRQDGCAEVDRIEPAIGYVAGNVQVLSKKANRMKSNASREELVIFARNLLRLYGNEDERKRYAK